MKKIFIVAIGLFISGIANAQSTDKAIKFGAKAGVNYSNVIKSGDAVDFKTDYLVGYHAGITLDIKLLENLAFTPEALYSTKGYKSKTALGNYTQTTSFIDIPVLASIRLGSGLNLVAGPQVSFLLSTKNKFESGLGATEQQVVEAASDRFKKSLVGGVIGFRYDFSNKIGINGRYVIDLQKINENKTTTTPEFKNQVFQLGLGLKF